MNNKMKRRVLSLALAMVMCLAFVPASALAADYTAMAVGHTAVAAGYAAINTGAPAENVSNVHGYARAYAFDDEGRRMESASVTDPVGDTAFTFRSNFVTATSDGHFYCGYVLYDGNFNVVRSFTPDDLYEIVNGVPRPDSFGGGSDHDLIVNGGTVAVVTEPLLILDYSGAITGTYTPDALHIDPYAAGRGVNIGSDGIITVWLGEYAGEGDEFKWVVVGKDGNVLADLGGKYSNVGTFNEGLAYAFAPDGEGGYEALYIDTSGQTQIRIDAFLLSIFIDGYAFVAVDAGNFLLYGVIDKSGQWVIEPQYEMISGVSQGVFAVKKDGKFGYVDANNAVLVPFEYDSLSSYIKDVGYGVKDGEIYAIKLGDTAISEPDGSAYTGVPSYSYKPSHWAAEQVDAAIEAGLVPENLQKEYDRPVSRGDTAQVIVNLIEKTSKQPIDAFLAANDAAIDPGAFTDATDDAVLAANALGIIYGVGDNLFDPSGTLSRSQIAAIVNRVARVLGVDTEGYAHDFTDVAGHWADLELGWPVYAEIIKGVGNQLFDPDGELTNEQLIAITYRAFLSLAAQAE